MTPSLSHARKTGAESSDISSQLMRWQKLATAGRDCDTPELANVCSGEVSSLPKLTSSWRDVSVLVPKADSRNRGILWCCSLPAEHGKALE